MVQNRIDWLDLMWMLIDLLIHKIIYEISAILLYITVIYDYSKYICWIKAIIFASWMRSQFHSISKWTDTLIIDIVIWLSCYLIKFSDSADLSELKVGFSNNIFWSNWLYVGLKTLQS